MEKLKRVVVTGLGALTPIGNNVEEFWNSLIAGKSGAGPITHFDATPYKTRFACEVKGFDASAFIPRQELRKMDRYTQYAIAVAEECMADSKLDLTTVDTRKIGVVWGSGIGGIETFEDEMISYAKNPEMPRFSPFFITKMIANMASGAISIRYGLKGTSFTTVSACTSSNHAIGEAFNTIRLGKANVILAGGSEAPITHSALGGFSSMKALSERNDTPETASRPFDVSRDGFVIGEGGAALMLEELDHALARGAKIYAELVGYGSASDAYHITASHPDGDGAVQAMQEALDEAGLKPSQVSYINAHGTSTPVGDISECKAISRVFADNLTNVVVGSTKSMTGHMLGGAGAAEAIAAILAIKNDLIPPTINLAERDSEIDPAIVIATGGALKKQVDVAMNNTFGFGGHIGVTLYKKFKQ